MYRDDFETRNFTKLVTARPTLDLEQPPGIAHDSVIRSGGHITQGVANLEEKAMSDIKMKYEVKMYNIAICVLLCV